jgi:hypothetical protein
LRDSADLARRLEDDDLLLARARELVGRGQAGGAGAYDENARAEGVDFRLSLAVPREQ